MALFLFMKGNCIQLCCRNLIAFIFNHQDVEEADLSTGQYRLIPTSVPCTCVSTASEKLNIKCRLIHERDFFSSAYSELFCFYERVFLNKRQLQFSQLVFNCCSRRYVGTSLLFCNFILILIQFWFDWIYFPFGTINTFFSLCFGFSLIGNICIFSKV